VKMCEEFVVGVAIARADGMPVIEIRTEQGTLCTLSTAQAREIAFSMMRACAEIEIESVIYRMHARKHPDEEAMRTVEEFRRKRREMLQGSRGEAPSPRN
jgi:hypothetical protein